MQKANTTNYIPPLDRVFLLYFTYLNRTSVGSDDTDDGDPPEVAGNGQGGRQVEFVELKDALLWSSINILIFESF